MTVEVRPANDRIGSAAAVTTPATNAAPPVDEHPS
jgi:hypothetical protein